MFETSTYTLAEFQSVVYQETPWDRPLHALMAYNSIIPSLVTDFSMNMAANQDPLPQVRKNINEVQDDDDANCESLLKNNLEISKKQLLWQDSSARLPKTQR